MQGWVMYLALAVMASVGIVILLGWWASVRQEAAVKK